MQTHRLSIAYEEMALTVKWTGIVIFLIASVSGEITDCPGHEESAHVMVMPLALACLLSMVAFLSNGPSICVFPCREHWSFLPCCLAIAPAYAFMPHKKNVSQTWTYYYMYLAGCLLFFLAGFMFIIAWETPYVIGGEAIHLLHLMHYRMYSS